MIPGTKSDIMTGTKLVHQNPPSFEAHVAGREHIFKLNLVLRKVLACFIPESL